MPTGQATDADIKLQREVEARGVPVTIRQLQEWRRLGIISGPVVVYLGRGKGTRSLAYPEGTADEVIRVYRALEKVRNLDWVVVGLFGVGVTPTERALRDAFKSILGATANEGKDVLQASDDAGVNYSRRVRRMVEDLRKVYPDVADRWVANSTQTAHEERREIDPATGQRFGGVSSTEIRERDARDLAAYFAGDESARLSPIFQALGVSVSDAESMDADAPTLAECQQALDATPIADVILFRDLTRKVIFGPESSRLPPALLRIFNENFDDPAVFGPVLAQMVLTVIAHWHREDGSENEELAIS